MEVGMTITMAACEKNESVVKKGALWDNTSTSRRALKPKQHFTGVGEKITNPCWQRDTLFVLC